MIEFEPPEHGGTYTDPDMDKPRQFDYRCRIWSIDPSDESRKCVLMTVECKNLNPSLPLVISGRPRTTEEAYADFIESHWTKTPGLRTSRTRKKSFRRFYKAGEFVGKSYLRPKADDKTGGWKTDREQSKDVYERWSQAVQSSFDLATSGCYLARDHKCEFVLSLVLPVVVVPDGTLWIASYNEQGLIEGDPCCVDECKYFVGRKFEIGFPNELHDIRISHIHFVTMTGLRQLLSGLAINGGAFWIDAFG